MSDLQYVVEDGSLLKPSQEGETTPEAAPGIDPSTVLSAPPGPGQANVRAQAITQLQRTHGNQRVQRLVARSAEEEGDSEGLAQAVDDRRGYGEPLPDGTRAQMESGLQQDLSGVRVHSDSAADQLSRQFNAKAFTTGQDVFFRQGAYDPGSSSGDKLLAHELTHVVQQGNAPAQLAGKKMNVSEPGDTGEQEADHVADAITAPAGVSRQEEEEIEPAVQRQGPEEEEEPLQTAVQRQGPEEEEEPLQTAVQRQGPEEEEPLQPAVQRQSEIPEEEVQESVQRQSEIPEEEVQESVQRQSEIPEEEVQESVQRQAPEEDEFQLAVQRQVPEEEEEPVQTQEEEPEEEEEEPLQTAVQRQDETEEEEI
jgi:hypothetical protein